MTDEKRQRARALFEQNGPILKTKVLSKNHFCSREIAELISHGDIQKVKTGYYIWANSSSDLSDIETVASVIPFGVICCYSAAQVHELTTANPLAVSIAIPTTRTRVAVPQHPPVELVSTAPSFFELGLTTIKVGQTEVRIYDSDGVFRGIYRKEQDDYCPVKMFLGSLDS